MNNDRAVEAVASPYSVTDDLRKECAAEWDYLLSEMFSTSMAVEHLAQFVADKIAAAGQAFQSGENLAPDNGDKDRGSLVEAPNLVEAVQAVAQIIESAIQRHGVPLDELSGTIDDAIAALAAARPLLFAELREPTPAMLDAFVARALQVSVQGEGGWTNYARNQWQTMLDAAIRTAGGKTDGGGA